MGKHLLEAFKGTSRHRGRQLWAVVCVGGSGTPGGEQGCPHAAGQPDPGAGGALPAGGHPGSSAPGPASLFVPGAGLDSCREGRLVFHKECCHVFPARCACLVSVASWIRTGLRPDIQGPGGLTGPGPPAEGLGKHPRRVGLGVHVRVLWGSRGGPGSSGSLTSEDMVPAVPGPCRPGRGCQGRRRPQPRGALEELCCHAPREAALLSRVEPTCWDPLVWAVVFRRESRKWFLI